MSSFQQPRLPIEIPAPLTPPRRRYHPRSEAPLKLGDGGCFDYAASPEVFLGRAGLGPLRVAWDQNVHIDWRTWGAALIGADEEALDDIAEPKLREELAGLGTLMEVWYTRDIRIMPLPGTRVDAKRRREGVAAMREEEIAQICSSLACVGLRDDARLVKRSPRWRAPFIRQLKDRRLVEEAIVAGCQVFLSRDERHILRHAEELKKLGLAAMSPLDLVTELAASGELTSPFGADGMACDSHKAVHVWALAGR